MCVYNIYYIYIYITYITNYYKRNKMINVNIFLYVKIWQLLLQIVNCYLYNYLQEFIIMMVFRHFGSFI